MYERPNFPETWARMHGKGRVFYTSMGHREDVWDKPALPGPAGRRLDWATGKVDASVEPNVEQGDPGLQATVGVNPSAPGGYQPPGDFFPST